jgi:hypothetical protein
VVDPNPGTAAQPEAVDCTLGQSGRVWYLAGATFLQPYSTAYRKCSIRAGVFVFFPVIDGWVDNLSCPGQVPGTLTGEQVKQLVQQQTNSIVPNSMSVTIDGRAVTGLTDSTTAYRLSHRSHRTHPSVITSRSAIPTAPKLSPASYADPTSRSIQIRDCAPGQKHPTHDTTYLIARPTSPSATPRRANITTLNNAHSVRGLYEELCRHERKRSPCLRERRTHGAAVSCWWRIRGWMRPGLGGRWRAAPFLPPPPLAYRPM